MAATEHETVLAVWIGSRDQRGLGGLGFDIGEISWARDSAEADGSFPPRRVIARHRGSKAEAGGND